MFVVFMFCSLCLCTKSNGILIVSFYLIESFSHMLTVSYISFGWVCCVCLLYDGGDTISVCFRLAFFSCITIIGKGNTLSIGWQRQLLIQLNSNFNRVKL